MSELEMAKDAVREAVRGYVEKRVKELQDAWDKRIAEVVTALPAPKDGKDGADAAVDYERVKALIAELIPAPVTGPAGEPGAPGKDAVVDEKHLEEIVRAEVGRTEGYVGPPGEIGAAGKDGKDAEVDYTKIYSAIVDLIQPKAVEIEKTLRAMIDGTIPVEVTKAVAALPPPVDGINGLNGKDGQDGQDGKHGNDGKDALELDILAEINPTRSYPRGTFAKHRGGLVRATRGTSPVKDGKLFDAGWETLVEGVADAQIEQGDDLRTFAVGFETTSGATFAKTFAVPVAIYRERWQAEKEYSAGDCVTQDGSMWFAMSKTSEKPGASPDWRLAVKHGRDGRDWDAPKPARPAEPVRLR